MGLRSFFTSLGSPETPKRKTPPSIQVRSITQAAQTGRLEASWSTTPTTADAQIYQEWLTITARCRKAADDYDHAKKFLQLVRDNVAGPNGFIANAQIRDPRGTVDTLAGKAIEDAYADFSKKGNFDVTGTYSRAAMERLLLSSWPTDGEVIILIKRGPKYKHGISFQAIDPVRLDPIKYHKLPNGNFIRHGIEMDEDNRPVAYYFKDYDSMMMGYIVSYMGMQYTRVPADEVIHWFVPEKIGQKRGLSPMRTALYRMRMLSGFEDAALINARVGAAKMGFFSDKDGDGEDDDMPLEVDAEPGVFENIGNREFKEWAPQFPETSIESFITTNLRSIGAGLNTSYHNLANDLTSVNFSSIRQGALDEREVWKGLQNSFRDGVVIPMFEAWLACALLNQTITINGKPLRFEKLEKYKTVSFIGRRWSWIDPSAEQTANERAVAQGFKSRSMVIRETCDMDPTDIWDEIKQDNDELEKRNIVPLIPSGSVPPADALPDGAAVQKAETTVKMKE